MVHIICPRLLTPPYPLTPPFLLLDSFILFLSLHSLMLLRTTYNDKEPAMLFGDTPKTDHDYKKGGGGFTGHHLICIHGCRGRHVHHVHGRGKSWA